MRCGDRRASTGAAGRTRIRISVILARVLRERGRKLSRSGGLVFGAGGRQESASKTVLGRRIAEKKRKRGFSP